MADDETDKERASAGVTVQHYVRVCRPRFEVAILEIDAADDDQAEDSAVGRAVQLPATEWHLLAFDDAVYQPHVESCHSEHTIDANVEDEPGEREEYAKELQSPERAEAMHASAIYCSMLMSALEKAA